MVKVIRQKAALPPHMDGSVVFVSWRQCAPNLTYVSLPPSRDHTPNGISIGSAVFAQLTAQSPYTLQWADFSHSELPISIGGSGPRHPSPQLKRHLD